MLINIKGYAKPPKHQLEQHMEYDGMNKDEVNPNGKHLWMQSMSMLKRENNMVKSKALKHMTAYEQCMKAKAMLTPPCIEQTSTKRTRNAKLQTKGLYNECLKSFQWVWWGRQKKGQWTKKG